MCGIVGYTGVKLSATSVVMDGLKRLEYRGYDSAGIALSHDDNIEVHKEVGRVQDLLDKIESLTEYSEPYAAIGHTRWATHGGVTIENAHPHISDKVAVVHNGIIDNADELKEKLFNMGYDFVSDTDSETIAHLIDSHLEDNVEEAVASAVAELHGTYGIAVLFRDFPGVIVAARNGSPLVIGIGENQHFVASDTNAISHYTNRFVYMEDGDIVTLAEGGMHMNRKRPVQTIEFEDNWAALGDYEHFMLKEINEQPESVRRCFGGRIRKDTCRLGGFDMSQQELSRITSVTIIGCGTSYHAGLVARNFIEKWSRIPCSVELASEFANKTIWPDHNGIYLAISQSGETYDTLESIRELNNKGSDVYGVVNVVGSSIARTCGSGVYIHSGPEISVASTKAFTGQLAALMMFGIMLGRAKHMDRANGEYLCEFLKRVPGCMGQVLRRIQGSPQIRAVAEEIAKSNYCLYLGRGASYPVAMEGALKLKELAYVPCESYAGGEMKHGPIAMIEKGTPVICINPVGPNHERMLSNIQEVKARGAKIIGISNKVHSSYDTFISIPSMAAHTPYSPFLSIIPLQFIAYYAALANGNDVDKPRNLAKSVTVG